MEVAIALTSLSIKASSTWKSNKDKVEEKNSSISWHLFTVGRVNRPVARLDYTGHVSNHYSSPARGAYSVDYG